MSTALTAPVVVREFKLDTSGHVIESKSRYTPALKFYCNDMSCGYTVYYTAPHYMYGSVWCCRKCDQVHTNSSLYHPCTKCGGVKFQASYCTPTPTVQKARRISCRKCYTIATPIEPGTFVTNVPMLPPPAPPALPAPTPPSSSTTLTSRFSAHEQSAYK